MDLSNRWDLGYSCSSADYFLPLQVRFLHSKEAPTYPYCQHREVLIVSRRVD